MFREAYFRATVAQSAIKVFDKTEIYPFNSDIFPDHFFVLSETTERPLLVTKDNQLAVNSQFKPPSAILLCPNNKELVWAFPVDL